MPINECVNCSNIKSLSPIIEDDFDNPEKFICDSCKKEDANHSEPDYGTCRYCGDDVLYPIEQINSEGECNEHKGESNMSAEEQEGWEGNIERWNDL